MSVGKDVIADKFEVEIDDVKCVHCEYHTPDEDNSSIFYCEFWGMFDSVPEGYCSFWKPEGGVSE